VNEFSEFAVLADYPERTVSRADQVARGLHDPVEHVGQGQVAGHRHDGVEQQVHPLLGGDRGACLVDEVLEQGVAAQQTRANDRLGCHVVQAVRFLFGHHFSPLPRPAAPAEAARESLRNHVRPTAIVRYAPIWVNRKWLSTICAGNSGYSLADPTPTGVAVLRNVHCGPCARSAVSVSGGTSTRHQACAGATSTATTAALITDGSATTMILR